MIVRTRQLHSYRSRCIPVKNGYNRLVLPRDDRISHKLSGRSFPRHVSRFQICDVHVITFPAPGNPFVSPNTLSWKAERNSISCVSCRLAVANRSAPGRQFSSDPLLDKSWLRGPRSHQFQFFPPCGFVFVSGSIGGKEVFQFVLLLTMVFFRWGNLVLSIQF